MRYQGEDVQKTSVKVVSITRDGSPDIRLQVRALPLGFEEDAERDLPSPVPKATGFATGRGGVVLRDPKTDKAIVETNENTPEFQLEVTRVNRLQTIRMLYEAIKDDPSLEFSTTREGKTPEEFYDGIFSELKEAGFTTGDYIRLVSAVVDVSGLKQEDVREAVQDFLSRG